MPRGKSMTGALAAGARGAVVGALLAICLGQLLGPSSAWAASLEPAAPVLRVDSVKGDLALGGRISVYVPGLRRYLDQTGRDARKFVLYLDGWRIDGITPQMTPGMDVLNYVVQRTDGSKAAWNALLGGPRAFTNSVSVSVGYDTEEVLASNADAVGLRVVQSPFWFWTFVVAFGLAFVGFLWLAWRTPIVKESSTVATESRPYSLGRVQMAFWFFAVLGSFIFIWMLTGAIPPLSESALALIGISAATALGARVADTTNAVALARKDPARAVAARARTSEGIVADLLMDADGYSFHRFQIAVWTIVLGVIFGWTVYTTLSMPEFGGTMLALMGISGGTYVGFKLQEAKAEPVMEPEPDPAPAPSGRKRKG